MIAAAVSYGRSFPHLYIAVLRFVHAGIISRMRHIHDHGDVRLERIRDLTRAQQADFFLHVGHRADFRLEPGF